MARVAVDIANGFYQSFSPQLANLECINLRPVVPESPAYSPTALRSTDGIREFVDTGLKTSRGAIESQGIAYFVQDNAFIRLNSDGTFFNISASQLPIPVNITGTGLVKMAASREYIWIVVPNGNSYYYDLNTGDLTLNLDPGFLSPALDVWFKDGFFFFNTDSIIFNSNLDGITFTPTDFGTAEVDPDLIQAGMVSNGQYYSLGTETIQPYQTIGGSGFPLSTIPTGTVERGLAARNGAVKADNTFFFIGGGDQQEVSIWRFVGNDAIKVSTPAIDHFMQGLSDDEIRSVFAWSYQTEGEEYVGFTFFNRTFVFQIVASQRIGRPIWFERSTDGTRWRVNTVVRAYNRIFVGDERTGKIGVIDPTIYTEYGDVLNREFTTQPFNFDGSPVFANSYEMVMASGVGNSESPNPVVNHSYSDNGINFTPTLARDMGQKGEYGKRIVWRRMGRIARNRVLKFQTHEPVETTFFVLEAEVFGSSAS